VLGQGSGFHVPDDTSPAYGGYAIVAGAEVRIGSGTQVNGDIHAGEDAEISPGGVVTGNVTAVGLVTSQAGVSGSVTKGAALVGTPTLLTSSEAESLTKAVFKGDTEFMKDLEVKGILYIEGDAVFYGSLNGVGTIIASEDIRLEEAPSATLHISTNISLIASGDIWVDRNREMRGLLEAGDDIKIKSGASFEGVAIAAGVVDLDPGVTVTYLALETNP
jgi:cytoskeletal protein CcmA (bactofilin family)